jgi:hypothetical protein
MSNIKMVCPNNAAHNRFHTTAHVAQDWIVDGAGNWLETTEDCTDIVHAPNTGNYWICDTCSGYVEAVPA